MEISPITGIRVLPVIKTHGTEQRITAIFDLENSSGPLDETSAHNGRNPAGGQDDEPDESEDQAESPQEESGDDSGPIVNLFA
jgi:hypothetical protein